MLTRLDITSSWFQFHFSAFECFWWFDINSYGCQLHLVKSWGPLHWSQQISSKQSQWRDSLQDTPMVDGKICPTNSTSQCQVWWWDLHLLLNFSIFWCWRPVLLLAIPWYLYSIDIPFYIHFLLYCWLDLYLLLKFAQVHLFVRIPTGMLRVKPIKHDFPNHLSEMLKVVRPSTAGSKVPRWANLGNIHQIIHFRLGLSIIKHEFWVPPF
jgi:hypothetical protein